MARRNRKYDFAGLQLRSKFEISVAEQLLEAGMDFDYEVESFEYFTKVPGCACADCGSKQVLKGAWYTPDFFLDNGIVIEAKGYFTAADRKKAMGMREYHPDVNLKLLFLSNNKIHKNSETRYSDWCEQHGFDYAIKIIPEGWLT